MKSFLTFKIHFIWQFHKLMFAVALSTASKLVQIFKLFQVFGYVTFMNLFYAFWVQAGELTSKLYVATANNFCSSAIYAGKENAVK